MDDKVRLASIGLGWWGTNLAKSVGQTSVAQLVACYDVDQGRREAVAAELGCRAMDSLEALFADPEIEGVTIATPHSTHVELVERAAAAGKSVHVEKPFTLNVADGRRAIRAVDQAGVVLQVGQNRRRQPANRAIKQMIDSGALGTVLQLESVHTSPMGHRPAAPWRFDPVEIPAGGMTGLGVHTIDTFDYFVGPAKRVFAFSKRLFAATRLDDATTVTIEYESGPVATLSTTAFAPAVVDLAVFGTDAAIWNELDGTKQYVQKRDDPARTEREVATLNTVVDELTEFARCIRSGGKPEVSGPEGFEVVAVVQAIVESVRTGRPAELSWFRQ